MLSEIFELMINNFPNFKTFGIAVIDSNNSFVLRNKAFNEMFSTDESYSVDDFSNNLLTVSGLFSFTDFFLNPQELIVHKSKTDKRQTIIQWIITIFPLFDENGKANYALCIVRDMSDLVHWQREFNLLFEKVPNLIAVLDSDFNVIRSNEKFRDTFGESGPGIEAYKKKHLDNKSTAAALCFIEGEEHFGSQILFTKNGDKSHFIVNCSPFSFKENGDVATVLEISTDITEINQLQEQLQHAHDFYADIIENSADGIIAIGKKGKTQIFNESAKKILNWNQQRKPGIPKIQEMLPKEFFDAPNESSKIISNKELFVKSASGESIPVRFNAFELTNKKVSMGRVAFIQDLRPVKLLEQERIDVEKNAVINSFKSLEESMKGLVGIHTIALENYRLTLENGDKDIQEIAWKSLMQKHHLVDRIVKAFLDAVKHTNLEISEVDISAEFQNQIDNLNAVAIESKVKIINKVVQTNQKYKFDLTAIQDIFLILISNAIEEARKSTEEPTITLELDEFPMNLIIKITDNGPIIPKEIAEKIFEVKASNSTRIGLITVDMLIKMLGGRIDFNSNKFEGNNFTIFLPIGV